MAGKPAPRIGPKSSPGALAKLDQRTREAAAMRSFRVDLLRQCGGESQATPVQLALIERACWLRLRTALFDRAIADGSFTEAQSNQYLAWSNALTRTLRALGVKSSTQPAKPGSALADYLKQHYGGEDNAA